MSMLNMLGGSPRGGRGTVSPAMLAVLGVLAYRTFKGKGRLADALGSTTSPGASAGANPAAGLSGGALLGGLTDLLNRFRQNNPKSAAHSWVSTGPNEPMPVDELEHALGAERVQWLMAQTGMAKDELLDGLATSLPEAIDKLTPEGRVPTEQELDRLNATHS